MEIVEICLFKDQLNFAFLGAWVGSGGGPSAPPIGARKRGSEHDARGVRGGFLFLVRQADGVVDPGFRLQDTGDSGVSVRIRLSTSGVQVARNSLGIRMASSPIVLNRIRTGVSFHIPRFLYSVALRYRLEKRDFHGPDF